MLFPGRYRNACGAGEQHDGPEQEASHIPSGPDRLVWANAEAASQKAPACSLYRFPAFRETGTAPLENCLVCTERAEHIAASAAKNEVVSGTLRASGQMERIGRMNSIRNRAEKMVFTELVYFREKTDAPAVIVMMTIAAGAFSG